MVLVWPSAQTPYPAATFPFFSKECLEFHLELMGSWIFSGEVIEGHGVFPTPWKMNGWNLQPSTMKRKENEPNLHEDMFHINLPGCSTKISKRRALLWFRDVFIHHWSGVFFFFKDPKQGCFGCYPGRVPVAAWKGGGSLPLDFDAFPLPIVGRPRHPAKFHQFVGIFVFK